MPYEFRIDSQNGLLEETYAGLISLDLLTEANASIIAHPDFTEGLKILTDLRHAQIPFGYKEMSIHVRTLPPIHASKQAFIVAGEREYGMIRMFSLLAEDSDNFKESQVFTSIEESIKWLNL